MTPPTETTPAPLFGRATVIGQAVAPPTETTPAPLFGRATSAGPAVAPPADVAASMTGDVVTSASLFGTSPAAEAAEAAAGEIAAAAPKAEPSIVVADEPSPFAAAAADSPFAAPVADSPFAAPAADSPFAAPPADGRAQDAAVAAELAAFAPASAAAANLSAGGASIDDDLVAVPSQSPVRSRLATIMGSRRNRAIAGGAMALLLVILVVALGGGKSKSKGKTVASREVTKTTPTPVDPPAKPAAEEPTEPATDPTAKPAAEEPVAEPPPDQGSATGSDTAPSDGSAGQPAASKPATPATGKPATPVGTGAKPAKTLGGKQVVLEYDAQAKETAKPVASAPKNEQGAILKARASYALGNQKLLAGDWNGAVLKYRQAIAAYPGYVAGYRGLGLAFMQAGDKPKALQALRLYISSVPNAKDAGLIRKRIEQLSK